MKRSVINQIYQEAAACFQRHEWALPPNPRWDITDFGLGDFDRYGLVLVNLANEPEYCEKLMYARPRQETLAHTHRIKKEDIICRRGRLTLRLWPCAPHPSKDTSAEVMTVQVNGEERRHRPGETLVLEAGERVTLVPGIYHAFWPVMEDTIIGEVSTANDDVNDNIFVDPDVGRFPGIEEDEPAKVRLISEG